MAYYFEDEFDIHPSAYIAPGAKIYGKVKIGANCSIWDGVVIRGDMDYIEIGDNSNIQENAVVHVDTNTPTIIGKNVTVGHSAVVHGAKIGNNCIIAINSTILNNAEVGNNCIIGAGSIVMERHIIPDNSVVFGIPGKVKKTVSDEACKHITQNSEEYVKMSRAYLKRFQK